MTRQQNGFEERLLTELRIVVAAGESTRPPVQSHRSTRFGWRPRIAAVAGVAAVLVAALAVGLPGIGGGEAAAYAVEQNANGTVTVEIKALEDAEGLERQLRDAGIPALVQYLPPGKTCKGGGTGAGVGPTGGKPQAAPVQSMVQGFAGGAARFTIDRSELRQGKTLVIRTQELAPGQRLPVPEGASLNTNGEPAPGDAAPKEAVAVSAAFYDGDVQPCEVVDA